MEFRPLTPACWDAFEDLFGKRGACGGCWCMLWRVSRAEFDQGKGDGNRLAMKALVDSGVIPGILAFEGEEAIGWCAIAPREDLPGLARSRSLKPLDDKPVWSVSCLFVRKGWRRKGVSAALLDAACSYVARQGGRLVEGYAVVPNGPKAPDVFIWTGTAAAFERAGFAEAARPSASRRIMRRAVHPTG